MIALGQVAAAFLGCTVHRRSVSCSGPEIALLCRKAPAKQPNGTRARASNYNKSTKRTTETAKRGHDTYGILTSIINLSMCLIF